MQSVKIFALAAAVILLFLLLLTGAFYYKTELEPTLPNPYAQAIKSQAKGPYSQNLPLIPICVRITGFDRETVHYTIYYFPFGSVAMSYHPQDGYNIEKPLSGI